MLLKIELVRSEPLIMRRVVVPAGIMLPTLHRTIQVAMGWDDDHLHEFEIGGDRYAPDVGSWDDDPNLYLEDKQPLDLCLERRRIFYYTYDFGDDWCHKIIVERRYTDPAELPHPLCVDGINACPPEGFGGIASYNWCIQVMGDAGHPDYPAVRRYLSERPDPEPTRFDLHAVNERLEKIRLSSKRGGNLSGARRNP